MFSIKTAQHSRHARGGWRNGFAFVKPIDPQSMHNTEIVFRESLRLASPSARSFLSLLDTAVRKKAFVRFNIYLVVILAIVLSSAARLYAQTVPPSGFVVVDSTEFKKCIVKLSGNIDESSLGKIHEEYARAKTFASQNEGSGLCRSGAEGVVVWLDSLGGDVGTAIKIGRFFRSKNAMTVVPDSAVCASACVLALLGGVERSVIGSVGIHRPFGTSPSDSVNQSQSALRSVNELIYAYLDEMNISSRVLDAMNAVQPEEVRWLDFDECDALGVCGTDPAWKDYNDSMFAKKLGISKLTLYSRRSVANEVCASEKTIRGRMACRQEIVANGTKQGSE
ncbi:MAG TPA: hypothetical protein VFN25_03725 [Dokdonella sp.]|uniref:COG3904 family protein n=1 Tax=Dokdonella sp. TaxID=2291710 RepID=UPI002D7F6C31|nr:hypothetical protein [Dokdonella sp.]HET9031996.1 hypothetical protein [Dokdonella sp.]